MNTENKKNIIIGFLMGIIITLIVVILLFVTGVFEYSDKMDDTENTGNVDGIKINKLDDNKDYVYDANYVYDNKYTEFERNTYEGNTTKTISDYGISVEYTTGMQYLNNLKVPYINIDSVDADDVNKKIEKLYLENAKLFDQCAMKATNNVSCSQILTYRTYQYENILSLVIIYARQETSPWVLNYDTYNFDLTDGSLLSYNDVLLKLKYDSSDILVKTEQLLKEKMNSLWSQFENDLSNVCYAENKNCYEIAMNKVNNSIQDNSILYFVNNDSDLSLLLVPYYDGVQNGETNRYLIEVEKIH